MLRKMSIISLYAVLSFVTFGAVHVHADELLVSYADWPPYEYLNVEGDHVGINVETVRRAAESLGHTVKFQNIPWARAMSYIKNGKSDAIMSLYHTDEREFFLNYVTVPLSVDQNVLISSVDNAVEFDGDISSLRGLNILVVRENSYGTAFDEATNFRKTTTNDSKQLLSMVAANRVKVGVISRFPYYYNLSQKKLEGQVKIIGPALSSEKLFMAFAKTKDVKYEALAKEMSGAIKAVKQTKWYQEISNGLLEFTQGAS